MLLCLDVGNSQIYCGVYRIKGGSNLDNHLQQHSAYSQSMDNDLDDDTVDDKLRRDCDS